jgi:methylmalonyl-CoA/ethylmalonyl-CoA epimerase
MLTSLNISPTATNFALGPIGSLDSHGSLPSNIAIRGLDHLGIAVASIAAARSLYETLGARFEGEEVVADQKVRVAFFRLGAGAGAVRIELLEPLDDESPIAKFLAKRGPGLHHVAYAVDDLPAALAAAAGAGLRLIDKQPRSGAHGAAIAFLHPQSTGGLLTELCSRPADDCRAEV